MEADYAKWMIEDPRVNFAISTRGSKAGLDHLGFQVDDAAELAQLKERAESADMALLDEGATTCCYARSEKHWVTDPQASRGALSHAGQHPRIQRGRKARDSRGMLRDGNHCSCRIRLLHSRHRICRKTLLLRPEVNSVLFLLLIHDHHITTERSVPLHPQLCAQHLGRALAQ
ncbi:glyoxalase/bleomycin resistance protein [Alicycliphilus sp. B1]|nr:glyoxalase/bleomycin resistance protein [Alicycliphilus sp. B1]